MLYLSAWFPITDPTLIFLVVLLIILFAPIVMGRLRIPHIVGMVLAGMLIGKYGFNILERDASFELFGRVGLYYIMFLAGLEMDMEGLKKNRLQVAMFGIATFIIPFSLMYFAGVGFMHLAPVAAMLLGCIMASNTLVAYPIVGRYGLQRHKSVTLSVGGTMMSLTLALTLLAAVVGAMGRSAGLWFWLLFLLKFVAYCAAVVFFVPRLVRWFLRRYSDAVMQFTFILTILFLCAALSNAVGLEGIFGAFFAGLVMNRFIPHVSPLMNRIEFFGNALFIPYFLIGVGMLINIRVLFSGVHIIELVTIVVVLGTLGKALAAYGTAWFFRLGWDSAHMVFGLTSAHAAGAIAMALVGMEVEVAPGRTLLTPDMLNAIVIMILFTCIISSFVTENAAKQLRLKEKSAKEPMIRADDEKILIPVKYPEYADSLLNLAVMMRNPKLNRGLIALNVVYDDVNASHNQVEGSRLLDHLAQLASAADVPIQTHVRLATNIANGIKHTFLEARASEIIMGLHFHTDVSKRFWGQFTQSLYNGVRQQIVIAKIGQPLSTLRRIVVAVPSRAEFEPGFYRWVERLARLAVNLECRIQFYGREGSLSLISEYIQNMHPTTRAEYMEMEHWNEFPHLASTIADAQMLVVVTARKGTISYKNALEHLPEEINASFHGQNLMIIFPDQYGEQTDTMTFAEPQHTEERSAYEMLAAWIRKHGPKLLKSKRL